MPMPSTMVTPSVHIVDRTLRSFVHSDWRRPENPYRPGGISLRALWTVAVFGTFVVMEGRRAPIAATSPPSFACRVPPTEVARLRFVERSACHREADARGCA